MLLSCLHRCLPWLRQNHQSTAYIELNTVAQQPNNIHTLNILESNPDDQSLAAIEISSQSHIIGSQSSIQDITESKHSTFSSSDELTRRLVAALKGDKVEIERFSGDRLLGSHGVKLVFDKLDSRHLRAICIAIRSNNKITGLELGCNGIGDSGAAILTECLHGYSHLIHLSVWGNDLTNQGLQSLSDLIGSCPLESLNLSNNNLSDEGVAAVSLSIAACSSLQYLNLSINAEMSDQGLCKLVQTLKNCNTRIKLLNLSTGSLSDISCQYIGSWLSQPSCPIESLDLSFNSIEDSGAEALASALTINNKLKELNFDGNHLSQKGLKFLLKISSPTRKISLENCLSIQ